jgi:hypothetical protein
VETSCGSEKICGPIVLVEVHSIADDAVLHNALQLQPVSNPMGAAECECATVAHSQHVNEFITECFVKRLGHIIVPLYAHSAHAPFFRPFANVEKSANIRKQLADVPMGIDTGVVVSVELGSARPGHAITGQDRCYFRSLVFSVSSPLCYPVTLSCWRSMRRSRYPIMLNPSLPQEPVLDTRMV